MKGEGENRGGGGAGKDLQGGGEREVSGLH